MDGMFGGPIGLSEGERAEQAKTLSNLSAAKSVTELDMAPLHKRLLAAQAGTAEENLLQSQETRKAFQDMSAGGTNGGPVTMSSLASRFEQGADALMARGLYTQAQKPALAASNLRLREQRAKEAQAATIQAQANTNLKKADMYERLTRDVEPGDQESFARANAIFKEQTGSDSPLAGQEFTDDLKRKIASSSMSFKDEIKLATAQADAESKQEVRKSRIDQWSFMRGFKEKELALKESIETRRAKVGGTEKAGGSPKNEEVLQAVSVIKKAVPGFDPSADRDAAVAIASDAKSRIAKNKALTWSEALNGAVADAQQLGDFELVKGGILGGDKTSYKPRGLTPGTAIEATPGKTVPPGRFIKNSKGQVGKVNPDGSVTIVPLAKKPGEVSGVIGKGTSPVVMSASGSSDEEDDDDGEEE